MKHSPEISIWENSASLVSAERGDLQNDFIEITEDEANQTHGANPCPMELARATPSACQATFTRSSARPSWRCSVSSLA